MSITEQMETRDIVRLRSLLQNDDCKLLFEYMSDFICWRSSLKEEAPEIKGMTRMLYEVKTLAPRLSKVLENR